MAWTYNQNFDDLTTGDLNGQDSWSGSTAWDVQTSVVQAGAKAISCVGSSSNENITRTITATTSGHFIFYMRATHSGGTHTGSTHRFRNASAIGRFEVRFTQNSNNLQLVGSSTITLVSGYSINTWYKIEIDYNTTTGVTRARVDDGAWSTDAGMASTGDITELFFQTNDAPSPAGTYYFDTISDNTPDINFDAFSSQTLGATTASPHTFSTQHTASGSNRIVIVSASGDWASAGLLTGVTYGGSAMTKIVEGVSWSGGNYISLWYLIAPATGAQSIQFTWTGGDKRVSFTCASYTGAKQSGQPDASTSNNQESGSSLTTTLTTVADKCWTVLHMLPADFDSSSAGAGTVIRQNTTGGRGGYADSNGEKTPAGSTSLIVNYGGSTRVGHVMASIAPFVSIDYTQSLSTSLAMTESKTSKMGVNKTDSFMFVESSQKNIGKRSTELFSFSELSSTASAFQRNPTESLSFAESMSSLSDFKKVFSDNFLFAESLSKQSGKSISDSLSMIELIARISEFQRALSDSLTISEAIAIIVQFQRMLTETLNISEALSKAANISFSSALSIAETMLTKSEYSRSMTENITIAESLLRLAEFKLNFSNIVNIAENSTKQTELSFSEALSILELFIKTSAFELQKIDTFAFAEVLSKQVGKPISDLVEILDTAPTITRGVLLSNSDAFSISEQFIKEMGLTLATTVAISESSTRLINFMRTFSDSIQITETLAKQLGLQFSELMSLAETLTKLINQRKQETVSIAENSIFSTGLGKIETISFSESFRKEAVKQNIDSLQISETLSKSSSLVVTDSVSIQELLKFENIKKITDMLVIAESATKAISIPLSSMLLITENIAKQTQRPLADNVSISEIHTATQDYAVHIVDSVALLEILIKEFGLSITDASTIAASISLNYMSAFATQRTTILTSIQGRTVLLAR